MYQYTRSSRRWRRLFNISLAIFTFKLARKTFSFWNLSLSLFYSMYPGLTLDTRLWIIRNCCNTDGSCSFWNIWPKSSSKALPKHLVLWPPGQISVTPNLPVPTAPGGDDGGGGDNDGRISMKMMIAVTVAMVVGYNSCNFSRARDLLRNSGELLLQHWRRPEPQTDIGALHSASESDNLQGAVCTPEPATRSANHWPKDELATSQALINALA